MNYVNKMVLLAVVLLGFGNSSFAYQITFNNKTNMPAKKGQPANPGIPVVVELVLSGDLPINYPWRKVIAPGKSYTFPFGAGDEYGKKIGFCYKWIKVTEYDKDDAAAFAKENAGDAKEKAILMDLKPSHNLFKYQSELPLIFDYFKQRIWQVPQIAYSKSAFDTSKIVAAMEKLGDTTEAVGNAVAKAASEGKADPVSVGLGSFLGAITDLIAEGSAKGGCGDRVFDIYSLKIPIPGAFKKDGTTPKMEQGFLLVHRAN